MVECQCRCNARRWTRRRALSDAATTTIALKQVELGAVCVCVQKISEAEAMVYGGVRGVLVTNDVVGRQKLLHPMSVAHNARCVDDLGQAHALDAAAGDAGVTLPVYVEVNMGGNRSGVEPG